MNRGVPVIVGGVYASIMSKSITDLFPHVTIFKGFSKELDMSPPDYDAYDQWGMEDPWNKFSFIFTTRGCPHFCPYCVVWKIEPFLTNSLLRYRALLKFPLWAILIPPE